MSFDIVNGRTNKKYGLNPFGTGQRLSTIFTLAEEEPLKVSIPLEQGSVFRRFNSCMEWRSFPRLNPFGTGQCLSTGIFDCIELVRNVSIPLEQGSVFRQNRGKQPD